MTGPLRPHAGHLGRGIGCTSISGPQSKRGMNEGQLPNDGFPAASTWNGNLYHRMHEQLTDSDLNVKDPETANLYSTEKRNDPDFAAGSIRVFNRPQLPFRAKT